eukprot:89885-Ditylum_brightwellii.AAC.1
MEIMIIQDHFTYMALDMFAKFTFGIDLQIITNPEKCCALTGALDEIHLLYHDCFNDFSYCMNANMMHQISTLKEELLVSEANIQVLTNKTRTIASRNEVLCYQRASLESSKTES